VILLFGRAIDSNDVWTQIIPFSSKHPVANRARPRVVFVAVAAHIVPAPSVARAALYHSDLHRYAIKFERVCNNDAYII